MNAACRLGGFVAAQAAVFGAALLVGLQVGAIGAAPEQAKGGHSALAEADHLPAGLTSTQEGNRLVLDRTTLPDGQQPLDLRAGSWRVYADVKHGGTVRPARFTLDAGQHRA